MRSGWLWAILAVALGVRVALLSGAVQHRSRAFTPDSANYYDLAAGLARTGSFGAGPGHAQPEIFRTPGYPAFLAAAILLSGASPETAGPWRLALAVQVLLDVGLVMLTYGLGRDLVGHRVGVVAAALQALSPLAIAACCRVLSDSLFALLLTAAVWLVVRHFRTGSWRALLGAAALLGVGCYVRGVGLAMTGAVALVLLARPGGFRRAGAVVGVVAACVAPWVARNIVVADYAGFSSFASDSLYHFSAAEVLARTKGLSLAEARVELAAREARHVPDSSTPGAKTRYRRNAAVATIAEHPWLYLGIHLKGALAFWLPGAADVLEEAGLTTGQRGTLEVLHRRGLSAAIRHYLGPNAAATVLAAVMAAILLVRYLGVGLCAVWRFRPPSQARRLVLKGEKRGQEPFMEKVPDPFSWRCRPRMSAAGWLMVLLVAAAMLLPGPANHPRFRVPLAPLLSIAAAVGWTGLLATARRRRRPGAA